MSVKECIREKEKKMKTPNPKLPQRLIFTNIFPSLWLKHCTILHYCYTHSESVQSLSCVWLFVTPWTAARHHQLRAYSNSCPSRRWCHPTISSCVYLLLLPPSIFPSIRVFSHESALHIRWPKYWSFSFNISPSNEYSGLISSRIDWFDLFAVQRTLKGLLQHHSSKESILWHSAFFIVQLSHLYITTGKPQLWLDGPLLVK